MLTEKEKLNKRQKLRNNEYYNFQDIQDELYRKSSEGKTFKNLLVIIGSRENILLAYRNIKKNKGTKTKGVNNTTIEDIENWEEQELIKYVRERLKNYIPQPVRRKYIEKDNGKKRPLGIPTMEDRLVQQCIKQVIEPIVEAKFHPHSYGFRPNRSTENAIARVFHLTTIAKLHYVVDVDIKSFFDEVDHGKLIKQLWHLGIRDKNLICIISKMLKTEVEGEGIQQKGVPQGGILSTVLANVVLNELDWWIDSQWVGIKTTIYKFDNPGNKATALKKTNLKEMYIVRYCDDFKIFCRNAKDAQKTFVAVKEWLNDRLVLEISSEKSKVTNLRKNYSEFLGVKFKIKPKKKRYVMRSHISDKAKKNIQKKLKERINDIKKHPSVPNCNKYNSTVLGMQNYYRIASNSNLDFNEIAFSIRKYLYNQTKNLQSKRGKRTKTYQRLYSKYNFRLNTIAGVTLFPLAGVVTRPSKKIHPEICSYTDIGRERIHDKLRIDLIHGIKYLINNPDLKENLEVNDNRISLYSGQQGRCFVTNKPLVLEKLCVHKKSKTVKKINGYKNLVLLNSDIKSLVAEENIDTVIKIVKDMNLGKRGINKLMKLRKLVGNNVIDKVD